MRRLTEIIKWASLPIWALITVASVYFTLKGLLWLGWPVVALAIFFIAVIGIIYGFRKERARESIADDSRQAREKDILDEKLLTTLRAISQLSKRLHHIANSTHASLEERSSEIQRSICDANSEVLLICYSLTFWKDKIEEQIHKFLAKDDSMFKVLMLMPDSSGFLEKSALEAFQYRGKVPTDLDAWLKSTEEIRKAHRSDIRSSIDTLVLWQQKYGKTKVDFRFYVDTPVLYGFSCDREVFYVSSYFINPIERAFRLPSRVFVLRKDPDPFSAMVASVFLNWFDTKFATGFEQWQIRWQK